MKTSDEEEENHPFKIIIKLILLIRSTRNTNVQIPVVSNISSLITKYNC